mmetsp:Transcript_26743/g.88894  ORF Transcript_26743/g.88894 Transcript_26743/m.88894 type:complete len:219 (-) Transcript_26743:1345-2001(-)
MPSTCRWRCAWGCTGRRSDPSLFAAAVLRLMLLLLLLLMPLLPLLVMLAAAVLLTVERRKRQTGGWRQVRRALSRGWRTLRSTFLSPRWSQFAMPRRSWHGIPGTSLKPSGSSSQLGMSRSRPCAPSRSPLSLRTPRHRRQVTTCRAACSRLKLQLLLRNRPLLMLLPVLLPRLLLRLLQLHERLRQFSRSWTRSPPAGVSGSSCWWSRFYLWPWSAS